MHLHHPGANRLSALDINGKYGMENISVDDLIAEGVSWGLTAPRARSVVTETVEQLRAALGGIDLGRYPTVPDIAIETVQDRLTTNLGLSRRELGGKPDARHRRRGPRKTRPDRGPGE